MQDLNGDALEDEENRPTLKEGPEWANQDSLLGFCPEEQEGWKHP